jgi:hypothetical protein
MLREVVVRDASTMVVRDASTAREPPPVSTTRLRACIHELVKQCHCPSLRTPLESAPTCSGTGTAVADGSSGEPLENAFIKGAHRYQELAILCHGIGFPHSHNTFAKC